MLETDLEASRATLSAIIERNKDLGKCNVFINIFSFFCGESRAKQMQCYFPSHLGNKHMLQRKPGVSVCS